MRGATILLVLAAACARPRVAAEAPNAARRVRHGAEIAATSAASAAPGPAASAATAPAPSSTSVATDAPPACGFRIVSTKTGAVLLACADGEVTGQRFPEAKLGVDGRLILASDGRVFRLAADGAALDGDEVFGRFVDDHTFEESSNDLRLGYAVADDGSLIMTTTSVSHVVTGSTWDTVPGEKTRIHAGVARVDAPDAVARKQALFVLASESRAANPLVSMRRAMDKSPAARAAAIGVLGGLAAALVVRVMWGDAWTEIHRQRAEREARARARPSPR